MVALFEEMTDSAMSEITGATPLSSSPFPEKVKSAVTVLSEERLTLQLPVPEHAPCHPPKVEPIAGVAAKAMTESEGFVSEQSVLFASQLIPDPVTDPEPVPDFETVRVWFAAVDRLKVAVTVIFLESETVHEPVPEQSPPAQPKNIEPGAGVAVSVAETVAFDVKEQVLPQLIEPRLDETVPWPVPDFKIESVRLVMTGGSTGTASSATGIGWRSSRSMRRVASAGAESGSKEITSVVVPDPLSHSTLAVKSLIRVMTGALVPGF